MKKILEKIQDILYDSLDYVIMLVIVLVVVAVIGWRLDVLFAKDVASGNKVIVEGVHNKVDDEPNDDEDTEVPEEPEEPETPVEEPPVDVAPVVPTGGNIKVTIPAGSLPGKIGSILADNGVINSSRDFIAKAVELRLDTKLKSGTFEIPQGSTHEEILKIITK
jgi:hypothetical protein